MRRLRSHVAFALTAAGLLVALACSHDNDPTPVRVQVHALQVAPGTGQVAVILTDEKGARYLPIFVGRDQAVAIQLGRQDQETPRPMTHDLMVSFLKALNCDVSRVTITELRENTYHAIIDLQKGSEEYPIDARPSDALALALRVDAPIFAMSDLLEQREGTPPAASRRERSNARSWGLSVQDLDEDLAEYFGREEGVLVSEVRRDTPAAGVGLQPGDVLVRFGDVKVQNVRDFRKALDEARGENEVTVTVERENSILSLTLRR